LEKGWYVVVGVVVVLVEVGSNFVGPILAVSKVRGLRAVFVKFSLWDLVINVSWPDLAVVVKPP
jgi:hypothetical protein